MRYWLMKSEPNVFGWDDLCRAGDTVWDGVRNHSAKLNLAAMEVGDRAFFYHSNIGREIVGTVEVTESGMTDPTCPDSKWAAVRVQPLKRLSRPVTLAAIKANDALRQMELVRLSRLSVCAVTPEEWEAVLAMAAD